MDINPMIGTLYHFPSDQLSKFLEQSFSLQWQKDAIFFWLLGQHENQTAATLSLSPTADSGKAGKPPTMEFFWSPTVCSLRTENIVLPRSGKQQ